MSGDQTKPPFPEQPQPMPGTGGLAQLLAEKGIRVNCVRRD
jgi:hypothetical protein